jgi:hypothetical protein
MKIIERKHIVIDKWNSLVERSPNAQLFDTSDYLDAVAENWCVLVDENYTKGIALPFSIRLGVKSIYTPIFLRSVSFLGGDISAEELKNLLKLHFPLGQLSLSFESENKTHFYQTIDFVQEIEQSNLGKRMLKRFEKNKFTIDFEANSKEVEKHIEIELPKKIDAINAKTLKSLNQLIKTFKAKNQLHVLTISKNNEVIGGLYLMESSKRLLYLKGAFTEDAKREGAMYGAMQKAIELAKAKELIFDFGGSRVIGVRRFNVNLGGKDCFYSTIEWNNAPFWFNWLKKIKNYG